MHKDYKDKGFEILAYPCNQFGAQEPTENADIAKFVK
jgi:glutathione peroxidase